MKQIVSSYITLFVADWFLFLSFLYINLQCIITGIFIILSEGEVLLSPLLFSAPIDFKNISK